jgi:hypothetical protein
MHFWGWTADLERVSRVEGVRDGEGSGMSKERGRSMRIG